MMFLLWAPLCLACHAQASSLDKLIAIALLNHPAIALEQAQQRKALADIDSAAWRFFPTPGLLIERATGDTGSPADRRQIAVLSLQQPLWTGGRLSADLRTAQAHGAVSEASLALRRQQLAIQVVQTYADWLAAWRKARAFQDGLASHAALRVLVERRIGQGISAESDLTLAEARSQAVAAEEAFARSQRDLAIIRLAQLLGVTITDTALESAISAAWPIGEHSLALVDTAMAISPAIQMARAQQDAQQAVLASRRADRMPELYLRAERQYERGGAGTGAAPLRVTLGLRSNFGPGLSSQAAIAAAQASYEAAQAELALQARALNEQVLGDAGLVRQAGMRRTVLLASLDASRQVADAYTRQFLAGRKSWIDVMNAARELIQVQVQLADVEAAALATSWRLAIICQGVDRVSGGAP